MLTAPVLIAPLTIGIAATSAEAASCKSVAQGGQPSMVWIGGLHNEGIISSASPGGTITLPASNPVDIQPAFFMTGIVPAGQTITFHFFHSDGGGQQDWTTNPADGNCVVHFDQSHDQAATPTVPDDARVFADYINWQTGQQVTMQFIGHIVTN
jgi:hypothetical protein